ncbi:cell division protein FtsI [Enterococcus sp. JM4C]|uniref:penicillin-binding transpeptidase domain-containing protein n=1 Tax=Candidatus Enterococcus huntleyi TaxID=1857217 RepID=UPI001379F0B4|nr:penicillin-binding transpeptidase domain-containing protein [Enterococcus sp. JM4C]KAF1296801.1 cell division protein FtsI [Enterococcus sp. JM4C]
MKKDSGFGHNKQVNETKEEQARRSHIPFRLNFLFFIIFTLFVALIAQLGSLQIINKKDIDQKIEASSTTEVSVSTPRGMIYDAKGRALVSNKANAAITFTRTNSMTGDDLYKLANNLVKLIQVDPDKLSERDKKDYWLGSKENLKKAQERLSKAEKEETDISKQYLATVDKVTAEEIKFTDIELEAATLFKRMNSAYALTTVFVKNADVTDKELALVAEHATDLPGISTGTDWQREYPYKGSLTDILGRVSSEKEGIQADDLEEYLAKGYARNDRVGTSLLEKQYEEVLQGTKTKYEITLDQNNEVVSKTEKSQGEKGQNLVLSIDSAFQEKVEQILKTNFEDMIKSGKAKYSPGVYAVALNPNNGDVLAMTGYQHTPETKELELRPLGTILDAYTPGSVVKGGTLTSGYEAGVITGNDVLIDLPIYIQGSAVKKSVFTTESPREISAQKALELSSNVYMMQIVFRMLGISYERGMTMPYAAEQADIFGKLRKGFNEYGMGVKTEIDIPNEEVGLSWTNFGENGPNAGNLLDLSFGQYDTYTTMQLAQYAATVANGGKRIAPHVVKGIYDNKEDGALGSEKEAIGPKVLNEVNITTDQMNIIRQGFYDAVHGNDGYTTARSLAGAKMEVSAKTGTAETNAPGNPKIATVNSNIVAYGPSDNPEIAISVMLPNLTDEKDHKNLVIAQQILDAYYDMYMK